MSAQTLPSAPSILSDKKPDYLFGILTGESLDSVNSSLRFDRPAAVERSGVLARLTLQFLLPGIFLFRAMLCDALVNDDASARVTVVVLKSDCVLMCRGVSRSG